VEGGYEYGKAHLGSIKLREVLGWMHNWRPLERGSAAWSVGSDTKTILTRIFKESRL
jgi:hypothetical protein